MSFGTVEKPATAVEAPQTRAIEVRRGRADEAADLASTLAAAFADDPFIRWMIPDDRRYERRGAYAFMSFLKEIYLPLGATFTTAGRAGAALWAPPGRTKPPASAELRLGVRYPRIFGLRGARRAIGAFARMEEEHPTDPHWYLAILGTAPEHQGGGIGSALVRHVTQRCDREGLPAYLEATAERNVPLYMRHGFEVTGEISFPGGPTLWRMWRLPLEGGESEVTTRR